VDAQPDQKTYDFKLRQGVKFHNGDPFTAEDVKFSFYRAKSSRVLKEKVRDVEIVDAHRVRFHLHEPFPDFMAFYGTIATASGWIVPKKYVEKVGDEGFKKHPIGLGPYKFVSNTPGIEVVLEANESYWRKMPSVKRLVLKSVPEPTTRAAMLKEGEVDIAYLLDAPAAQELKRDPNFRLAFSGAIGIHFLDFLRPVGSEVAVARPPGAARGELRDRQEVDQRRRESRRLTPDRGMVPRKFEFALTLEPYPYDPAKAKQLLAEAGYPNGFDAGDLYPYPPYYSMGEAVGTNLGAIGIKTKIVNDGARDVPVHVAAEEAEGRLRLRPRALRQRGHTHGRVRADRGIVHARRDQDVETLYTVSKRARRTGRSARRCCTRSRSSSTTACVRPDVGIHLADRHRAAGGDPALMKIDPYPWSAPYEDVTLKK